MGMMEGLEKGKHLASNLKLSMNLTHYLDTVVKQITAIATSLAAGFEKALQQILMYAPGLEDMKALAMTSGRAQSAVNDAKKLAGDRTMAAKVYIHSVVAPVEFTDTDGDVSRLAMDDSGALIWYEPDEEATGEWQEYARGPLVFTPSTGELTCDDGDDDEASATIKCAEATARLLRAARGPTAA